MDTYTRMCQYWMASKDLHTLVLYRQKMQFRRVTDDRNWMSRKSQEIVQSCNLMMCSLNKMELHLPHGVRKFSLIKKKKKKKSHFSAPLFLTPRGKRSSIRHIYYNIVNIRISGLSLILLPFINTVFRTAAITFGAELSPNPNHVRQ